MDHAEHRAATANSINFQMAKVILLLKESSYLPEFSQAEVQRMIGIIRTNGMKLESLRFGPQSYTVYYKHLNTNASTILVRYKIVL